MDQATSTVIAALKEAFVEVDFAPAPLIDRGGGPAGMEQIYVRVPPDKLPAVMRLLRDDPRCNYNQLCDLTCVDYLDFKRARDRYGVIYSLLSLNRHHRIWVKCLVNDPEPEVPSVTSVWPGSERLEREVWDMFGIRFTAHPNLRRLLLYDEFHGHPLRKDYPVRRRQPLIGSVN